MTDTSTLIAGNFYGKFESRNPIARVLVRNFWGTFDALVSPLEADSVLEVGCGEGWISHRLRRHKPGARIWSTDLSENILQDAARRFPEGVYSAQSAYQLGFPDDSFDLVVLCEVCEHLAQPEKALIEASRVCRKWLLLSVPREPLWRLFNLARGAYIRDLGNTPGHVQHWGKRGIVRLVENYFRIRTVRTALPWTFILGQPV